MSDSTTKERSAADEALERAKARTYTYDEVRDLMHQAIVKAAEDLFVMVGSSPERVHSLAKQTASEPLTTTERKMLQDVLLPGMLAVGVVKERLRIELHGRFGEEKYLERRAQLAAETRELVKAHDAAEELLRRLGLLS